MKKYLFSTFLILIFASCDNSKESDESLISVKFTSAVSNKTAYIPPQCYTNIENSDTSIQDKIKNFNPCYACHTTGREPNYIDSDLTKKTKAFQILKNDISYLLLPTKNRAENLNKAYKLIVDEQSFILGRDSTISPAKNIFKTIN